MGELEAARCISVEDEMDLVPLNLAMICTHHILSYINAELFSSLLSAKTKRLLRDAGCPTSDTDSRSLDLSGYDHTNFNFRERTTN